METVELSNKVKWLPCLLSTDKEYCGKICTTCGTLGKDGMYHGIVIGYDIDNKDITKVAVVSTETSTNIPTDITWTIVDIEQLEEDTCC